MSTSKPLKGREPLFVEADRSKGKPPLNIYGDLVYLILTGKDTQGGFAVMEDVSLPGNGPPWHVHHREDELFQVLEGEYIYQVSDRRIEAKAGDFVFIPKDIPHAFQNVGQTTGRALITVQPSGLEVFFQELAALSGPPDPAKVAPMFQKFGMELLGPPLGLR
jgi:quercetin dioxygenase-like cupin family protein